MMFLMEILSIFSQRTEPVGDRREGIIGGTWLQRGVQGREDLGRGTTVRLEKEFVDFCV